MEKKMQFFNKCPACGKELGGREDKCPYCGFEGLHTVFLSQEDYLHWQKTILDPYKETIRMPHIFAGKLGVLILMPNGDLYGYGNNDTGAFGKENYGHDLTKSQLVAKNVKSAALGYNYSIYLTKEGKVELLGKSNIPFRERFQGISGADEVYASGINDIFWVKYKNGELGVWGNNSHLSCIINYRHDSRCAWDRDAFGRIAEVTEQPLSKYERIVEEYEEIGERYRMLNGRIYSPDGLMSYNNTVHTTPTIKEMEKEIQETDEFRMYAEKYSALNIIFVMDKEKNMSVDRETIQTSYGMTSIGTLDPDIMYKIHRKSRDALYKIHMYFKNNYLYHPIAVQEDAYYVPELVKSGSGLIDCDNLDGWRWLYGVKIEYFDYDCSTYIARLLEDGELEVVRYNHKGGRGDGAVYAVYEEVADVSVSVSHAYIMTKDKILYCLPLEDFINAKKLSEAKMIDY